MIEREIAEFGRRMGMPAFSLSPAGLAALDVERLGRLHLELAENAGERELLVYLARAVPEYDVKAPRRVLERCHYRHADPMPLSGGVHKGNIVLLTRFPERQATAAGIERAVQFLSGVMDTVAKLGFLYRQRRTAMPSINLLDPSLGIQTIMESPAATRGGIPEARPLASNVLREAGLEELYSPCNAHHLVEQALCPDAGDGDILRPEVFSGNLAGCLEALKDSDDPAVRALVDGELAPLLQNKELLNAYMGLMIGG